MAEHSNLPHRTLTNDEDAISGEDVGGTTNLLLERLQAYKHMCGYLEDYIGAVAKYQHVEAKEEEKILKTISNPLKEGHHFSQQTGGIASLFENIRQNSQTISNLHLETEQNLRKQVLPVLETLHSEIKNKNKELTGGAAKGSKSVDRARNTSQKHIELLGQHTSAFDSVAGHRTASNDPYILKRGINHRLNKQLIEENNNRQDLIAVQTSFQSFEGHVLQTVQAAMQAFNQVMGGQAEKHKVIYGDMLKAAQGIPGNFEWNGFVQRNNDTLIDPNAPPRSMSNIAFPNQDHRATKPLIEGTLESKSGGALAKMKSYNSGYFAVTPAGFLHEFKDNDDFRHDPIPENSFYLPDCIIGAVDGVKFTLKGKDTSGGKLSQKIAQSKEISFKAHNQGDAQQWHNIIASQTGGSSNSAPVSPVQSRVTSGQQPNIDTTAGQQTGVVRASPTSAGPHSAAGQGSHLSPTANQGPGTSPMVQQSVATSQGGAGSHFHGPGSTGQPLEDKKFSS